MKFLMVVTFIFVSNFSYGGVGELTDAYLTEKFKKVRVKTPTSQPTSISNDLLHAASDTLPLVKIWKSASRIKLDSVVKTRSAADAALYKSVSPSVVLVVTNDGIGSGSIISNDGEILTNWHVVGSESEVGVVFKPLNDTQKLADKDFYRAKVLRIDQVSDLALIKVSSIPNGRPPIKLGESSEINIGADAHAIGHPNGESWSYTKGVISQYRHEFAWTGGEVTKKHSADVLQMQTPINPGNSGGPLLSDSKTIIGVNSFKQPGSEGMNFAVSIDEVKKFLARSDNRYFSKPPKPKKQKKCVAKQLFHGKTDDNSANLSSYDTNCSGKSNLEIIEPFDQSKPIIIRVDSNGDDKPDVVYVDVERKGKVAFSFYDTNYDDNWDLVGYHNGDNFKPSRYESYEAFKQRQE